VVESIAVERAQTTSRRIKRIKSNDIDRRSPYLRSSSRHVATTPPEAAPVIMRVLATCRDEER